jgi:plastocyanin
MLTTINPAQRRRRIAPLLGVVSLLAVALPELSTAGEAVFAAAASPATVNIDNFAFAPATLTVTAGTTVTWKNEDDSPHRIGDKNGTFKSAALDTDDTFSHTFAAPGEYPYICTIHPYMAGKIIVKPAARCHRIEPAGPGSRTERLEATMWYHPAAFAVGKRNMIGALLVCFVVAVTCLGSSMF